jgi:hypothetical protein
LLPFKNIFLNFLFKKKKRKKERRRRIETLVELRTLGLTSQVWLGLRILGLWRRRHPWIMRRVYLYQITEAHTPTTSQSDGCPNTQHNRTATKTGISRDRCTHLRPLNVDKIRARFLLLFHFPFSFFFFLLKIKT